MADVSALPDWPALMDTALAAAYCSMSEASFRFVARRRDVKPVDTGLSLVRWRRKDLDGLIDSLPGRGANSAPVVDVEIDPAETALRRARDRARR
jgi:hypothetical protein